MSVSAALSWLRRTAFAGAVLATALFALVTASLPAAAQYYPYYPYYPYSYPYHGYWPVGVTVGWGWGWHRPWWGWRAGWGWHSGWGWRGGWGWHGGWRR